MIKHNLCKFGSFKESVITSTNGFLQFMQYLSTDFMKSLLNYVTRQWS